MITGVLLEQGKCEIVIFFPRPFEHSWGKWDSHMITEGRDCQGWIGEEVFGVNEKRFIV